VLSKLAARALASIVLVALLVAILAAFTPVRVVHPAALFLSVIGVTSIFVALGVSLATRLRRLESFRLVSALVTVPLYLFSGIFYPISTLPAPTRWVAHMNPLTYGVDLLRYGLLGVNEIPVAWSAAMLAVLTVLALVVAVAAFDRGVRG
jgi:ABC-2 type transport system permease protein